MLRPGHGKVFMTFFVALANWTTMKESIVCLVFEIDIYLSNCYSDWFPGLPALL